MRAAATRSAPAPTAHRTRLSSLRPRTTTTPGRVQLARVMKRQERARESAIEKGEDFFRLAAHGSLSEMEELLREGIRLDAVDAIYGRTALMVAAASNSDDVVSAILNSIEDPKIDLRMTSPVRPIETPLPPQVARKAAAPLSSWPFGRPWRRMASRRYTGLQ